MCGIVGYIGEKKAAPILMEGLKKLEYRGYDSAGIAIREKSGVKVLKKAGKLRKLEVLVGEKPPVGDYGIGHTRWATHGSPSDHNSHPHQDCKGEFVIVHNGIIENFQVLKDGLLSRGHEFKSDTDSEVIAHLLEEIYNGDMIKTIIKLISLLEGSYALSIMAKNEADKLYAVRQDSPLIVGLGDNENFIASDIPAFLSFTRNFYILNDGEIAEITGDSVSIFNYTGKKIEKDIFRVDWDAEMVDKGGFEHFMLKEITKYDKGR